MGIKYGQHKAKLNPCARSLTIRIRRVDPPVNNLVGVYCNLCPVSPMTGEIECSAIIHDQKDVYNKVAACMHRFGREMPIPNRDVVRDFTEYSKLLIERLFKPVQREELCTFAEWIEHTHYTPAQRRYFTKIRRDIKSLQEEFIDNKSFIKWEAYTEIGKQCRAINSYSDNMKAVLGPVMHSVDRKIFSTKYFVKGMDPRMRPEMLKNRFGTRPVMGTDFSSYEAHHSGAFAELGRHWILHMTRELGLPKHVHAIIGRAFLGRNKCDMRDIVAEVDQRLMSGALWTSSANGVLNLMMLSYLNSRAMYPHMAVTELVDRHDECFQGFVEGDDGICVDRHIPDRLIESLGIVLKFDHYTSYGQASFCGIVCDENENINLSDPMKFLSKFFVLPPKYAGTRQSLQYSYLRAKALSYKYALNDCPVIGPVCHAICRMTKGVDAMRAVADVDTYKRDLLLRAVKAKTWRDEPDIRTASRLLVARVYGLSIHDQIMIEEAFTQAIAGPIHVKLDHLIKVEHLKHAFTHVREFMPNLYPEEPRIHLNPDDAVCVAVREGRKGVSLVGVKRCCNVYAHHCGSVIPTDPTAYHVTAEGEEQPA